MIDVGTFGKTRAAIALAKILNEVNDNKATNKSYHFVDDFNCILRDLKVVSSRDTKYNLSTLAWKDSVEKVKQCPAMPDKVKTYVINVLTTTRRKFITEEVNGK
jgi:hypothetical protein